MNKLVVPIFAHIYFVVQSNKVKTYRPCSILRSNTLHVAYDGTVRISNVRLTHTLDLVIFPYVVRVSFMLVEQARRIGSNGLDRHKQIKRTGE